MYESIAKKKKSCYFMILYKWR